MSIQEFRLARAAKAKEVKNLLDTTTTVYSKDVQAKVDGLFSEIELIDGQIARSEKASAMVFDLDKAARDRAAETGRSADEEAAELTRGRRALVAYLRGGIEALTAEHRPLMPTATLPGQRQIAALDRTSSATGGVTVPTIVMPTVLAKLKAYGGMRQAAREITTNGGYQIAWPAYDDTASEGEFVAENVAATAADFAFGSVALNAYKMSSKIIVVSIELLQDSAVDIEQVVLDALYVRLARGQNRKFTTGAGVTEPTGAVTAAVLGTQAAVGNTTSISYDNMLDLIHALDPAYRMMQSVRMMMHDTTLKAIKKLKDSTGRPLWLPGTGSAIDNDESDPDTIDGYPIVINQHMPVMAASAKAILFGAFEKYLIRDVMEMQILRLTDSAYSTKGQVGFLAWMRVDGNLVDASGESIRYFQNSAT
jgi:HK97 family phage major capsid protein